MKICTKCKTPKKLGDFTRDQQKRDGLRSSCKVCNASDWQRKDKGPLFLAQRSAFVRKHALRTKYGITEADYLHLLVKQHNACAICERFETSRKAKRLSVDHCHKTGKVRGLLCQRCNAGIGQFLDNPKLIRRAFIYMRGSS